VPQKPSRLTQLAITTAPVVFVLLWSTGFIGARFGLPYIEPLTFLAVRMIFVVMLMAAIALVTLCVVLLLPAEKTRGIGRDEPAPRAAD